MKKGLNIPRYKAAKKNFNISRNFGFGKNKSLFSYTISLLLLSGAILGGLSLRSFTGYDTFENFPVGPSTEKTRSEDPLLNRGYNPNTLIEVTPDPIIAGGTINIAIDPGLKCTWQRAKVYYWGPSAYSTKECGRDVKGVLKDDNIKIYSSYGVDNVDRGGFKICETKTFPYTTSASWSEGTYAIAAFDYNANEWICEPFVVYRGRGNTEDIATWEGSKILDELLRGGS